MKRKIVWVSTLITLLVVIHLGTTSLSAHESYGIIGKVVKLSDAEISVQDKDNKIFTVGMRTFTRIMRGKKNEPGTYVKVARSELKTGLAVAVNAFGDSEEDLIAQSVIIMPPSK